MKLSRNLTVVINQAMDQLIPPFIRDARWFMQFPMQLFAKDKAAIYMDFKEKAFTMSAEEFARAYQQTGGIVERDTDLNDACVERIMTSLVGNNVLEAGCGRGYLLKHLAARMPATGCDVVIDEKAKIAAPSATFLETNIESLPFSDGQFDTVVCTHTLEHVVAIQAAIKELRRVAAKRLIIVVPRERPYRYTFSLHLHFFPYRHSLLYTMGPATGRQSNELVGGDWLYIEDMAA